MSIHLLQHQIDKKILQCKYKNKNIPIGFIDSHLAENVAKRITYDIKKSNVRLKLKSIDLINLEDYVFEEETKDRLRCLSRDIHSSIILDRETKEAEKPHPWNIKSIDEKTFYAFPLNSGYNGIAICHDVDDKYLTTPFLQSTDDFFREEFLRKIIALKTIIILFDTPTPSQLNRLFRKK